MVGPFPRIQSLLEAVEGADAATGRTKAGLYAGMGSDSATLEDAGL